MQHGRRHHSADLEGPYTNNNTNFAPTLVTALPPADLQVSSIVTQPTNYSGEKTTVSWTVTNFGATAWSGTQYWVDSVYFSKYPTLDVNRDTLEGVFPHSNAQPLGAGASNTETATFKLPPGNGGTAANPLTYYIYVITGHDYENGDIDALTTYPSYSATSVNNYDNTQSYTFFTTRCYEDPTNDQSSATLPVIYREADLVVSNLIVPTIAPSSGSTIAVTWTVTNQGTRDTRTSYWIDRVYLSPDPSLANTDIELGEIAHQSILAAGDSYTVTLDVPLPDGISGPNYILVYTDSNEFGRIDVPGLSPDGSGEMGRVLEYQGEGNNITAAYMPIALTPPPDLQVSSVVAQGPDPTLPDHVYTGQSFTVTYTVTNTGPGDTPANESKWYDQIWLSRDQNFADATVYLDELTHTGGLKAGASYTITDTLKAQSNITGPWYVFVITDPPTADSPTGAVFENSPEDDNTTATATPLLIDQPPPADLSVQAITIPGSAMTGDPVEIKWTVENIGTNPASGTWTDAAYLSPNAIWNYTDPVIGQISYSGTLQPGQSYTQTLDANLPGATPGQYRVIIRTNIFVDIPVVEPLDNATASPSVLSVTVPALQLGVPVNTTLDTGENRLYEVTVPQGDTLRVDVTSTNNNAANELFLRYNELPTSSTYDAAYQGALQANQYAVIPSTTDGIYYILVTGQSEPAAATPMTIVANVLPFEITNVTPDGGGDSAYVSTTIEGAQFDPQAIVKLVRPGIAEYEPVSYQVVNASKIIAIFDLTNAPHGLYDVEVINPNGQIALAPYRYLVEQALPPQVSIALGGPRVVWAGQSALYGFSLTNTTNVDIPYVYYQYGVPALPLNGGVPYLGFSTSPQGSANVAGVDWSSVNPIADTNGQLLSSGYAIGFADQASTTLGFQVQTYPDGLPPDASDNAPAQTAFAFNIVGAATPLTADEFIAMQEQFAATLRTNILADPTASSALQTLAADPTNWTDLYLTALTQAGLLRPVDVPPQVEQNPVLVSLQTTLAAGILAGPAGKQIVTNGNLVSFFSQVAQWYSGNSNAISQFIGTGTDNTTPDEGGTYLQANPAPASFFNQNATEPTQYEGFYVYVPYSNDYDQDQDPDATNPQNANFVNVSAPNFAPYFTGAGQMGQAVVNGPLGYGAQQFLPVGQALPFTIDFQNSPAATTSPGQIRIVSQLDPNLDPRTFRLGSIKLGDITVNAPSNVGSFQEDIDLTNSKGYILRVSAGFVVNSDTMTWLLLAIDPTTGEVITNPNEGLLPPDDSSGAGEGFVSYTVEPLAGTTTGTQVSAQARVLFNTGAPLDTPTITYSIDGTAPTTTLTATAIAAGSSNYNVQWNATDDPAGSGVKSTTVYVSEDGGNYTIWQNQTTATSGIYDGQAGHTYQFLALSIDNAGNREQPPAVLNLPDDGSTVNLGALPTVGGTTQDLGSPPAPSGQSTNPLVTQAQQGIPSPAPTSNAPQFTTVIAPFSGRVFATGIGQSQPSIGPMALLPLPNGSVLISGGPARNELFLLGNTGGQAGTPVATFAEPIYDMALDANGDIWATTGGGPLYEINSQTYAIMGQWGDGLTQSLAIDSSTGLIYVSSGKGIEVFDPTTDTFSHFSDIRVGSLGFDNQDNLWAATWPQNTNQIIEFTGNPIKPKLMFTLDSDVDSIAFGQAGSQLAGLMFVSHTDAALPGDAGSELTMIDLATLQQVAVATGGTRGDEIATSSDGRVFISQSNEVDELELVQPPHVASTNPPAQGVVALPLGTISITFDQNMFVGNASNPNSVLNPTNYSLVGANSGPVTFTSITYDAPSRTVTLTFDNLNADHYTLQVLTGVENTVGLPLAQTYSTDFTAVTDFSPYVNVVFSEGRANALAGTVTYNVTVTNETAYNLVVPLELSVDDLQPSDASVVGGTLNPQTGEWWLDLSGAVPGNVLIPGGSTLTRTFTVSDPSGGRIGFQGGLFTMPYANVTPVLNSTPVTTATAGQAYDYTVSAFDPNNSPISYVLTSGPAGMTINANTGLLTWSPMAGSPAQVNVTVEAFNVRGGHAMQQFAITVSGVTAPPDFNQLPSQITGTEGQALTLTVHASDAAGLPLVYWADNLPGGAAFDFTTQTLSWLPAAGQAGTYPNVTFVVSDGLNQVSETTTLVIAPELLPPVLTRPADRTALEGESIQFTVQASDPNGLPLTYASSMLPGGAVLDPHTGLFSWTPNYDQHGDWEIPFTAGDGQHSTTVTVDFTIINVNAPPVFNYLGNWRVQEGQDLKFLAFAFDPNNPGYVPQQRIVDGQLSPLQGTNPTITYTITGLHNGATLDPQTELFDWTPGYSAAGNYVVTFTATNDGDGTGVPLSTTVSVPITVLKTYRAPIITAITNHTIAYDTTQTLTVQAQDLNNQQLGLSVVGLPSFAAFTDNGNGTGTFTFSPGPYDARNYTLTVNASDAGGGPGTDNSSSQSFVLTVTNPNLPPLLAPIGDKVAVVGEPFQLTLTATDGLQDPLTFSAMGLPGAATLTPAVPYGQAVINWTPTAADVGRYTILVSATDNDNDASDQQTFTLVVATSDQPPVWLPAPNLSVSADQTLTAQVQAVDPDGFPLTYSATNLPPGAVLNPLTGALSWATQYADVGTYPNVVLHATDGSLSADQTVTITVNPINLPPQFVPLQPQSGREGTLLQFTVAADDPDGDALTYSVLSGLPTGATLDPKTGHFQWTPNYGQAGDYTITFGVTDPGGLTDRLPVSLHIDFVDRPPTLTVTNHQVDVGQPFSLQLLGSSPNASSTLTYSALGMPEGATLNPATGLFQWTPGPTQVGDYEIQFTVSDGDLQVTQPVLLRATINPVLPQVLVVLTPSFPTCPAPRCSYTSRRPASRRSPASRWRSTASRSLWTARAGPPSSRPLRAATTFSPRPPTATDSSGSTTRYSRCAIRTTRPHPSRPSFRA